MTLIRSMIDAIRKQRSQTDQPVRLLNHLANTAELRVPVDSLPHCIAMNSMIRWHDLGVGVPDEDFGLTPKNGVLDGWRQIDSTTYGCFQVKRDEFKDFAHAVTLEDWQCDITDIHGFVASKSTLENFASTDAMVEEKSPSLISEITLAKLHDNLAHTDIGLIHKPGEDWFCRYGWDNRLFVFNTNGSHHLAAAKYIAFRLGKAVPLRAKLEVHELNVQKLRGLRSDYDMFVVSKELYSPEFHEAMKEFGATYLSQILPKPFDRKKVTGLYLPKNEPKSALVAQLLRQADTFDFGVHLSSLAERQQALSLEMRRRNIEGVELRSSPPSLS